MENEKWSVLSKKLLTDTILLGLCTLFGYSIAFCFQYGYLSYFNIPPQFIRINIVSIFLSSAAIIFVSLVVISLLDLLSKIFDFRKELYWRVCIFIFYTTSCLFLVLLSTASLLLIVVLLAIGIVIFYRLFLHPKLKNLNMDYQEALKHDITPRKSEDNSLLRFLLNKGEINFGKQIIILALFAVLIALLSFLIGSIRAGIQTYYYVLESNERVVLIPIDDKLFISTSITSKKTLTGKLSFHTLEKLEVENTVLMYEYIGPLKRNKPDNQIDLKPLINTSSALITDCARWIQEKYLLKQPINK